MKLTMREVKELQERLNDIIQNINGNMEIISNKTISDMFLRPIMKTATEISDEIFIQTRDMTFDVEI